MAEVAKLALQASSTGYSPLKDMLLYMKSKSKFVKKLQDNVLKMIEEMTTLHSRKKNIDQKLEKNVPKEKSDEYRILIKQIDALDDKYKKYLKKYGGLLTNLPSFQSHDVSSAEVVFDVVQETKPTIWTCKFFKLATLSKKTNELLVDISRVIGKMDPENLFRDKETEAVQEKHDDIIVLPSFAEYVEKILSYLKDDDNRSIGISGPIGVGKTTIMKRLNNRLSPSHLFGTTTEIKVDFVIWIDAEDGTTKGIQDVIMERLKLESKNTNNIEHNAGIISEFLMGKKYILLIDHFSSTINLDEVGIHKNHKLGQVVVASRSKKVIAPMIDEHVEIKRLSQDDAFVLFQAFCGPIPDASIKDYARHIVSSCGGLPSVIKLVAHYLKGIEKADEWSDTKRLLQSETKANLQDLEGVGHAYKLVYDKLLKSRKKCLLFASLFPSDHKICKEYIVECWNAERFLELDVPELRAARDRGATILRELTDQYLLENHSDKHVKMPTYFRKVVADQEYPDEIDCLSWLPQKFQSPTEETWRTTRRMSLIRCNRELPIEPICDNISTLLMQCNSELVSLEKQFFQNMQKLLILDLHGTMIVSLPISISSLVSLRCLYLNDCPQLAQLPPQVNELKKLELLDIRRTAIRSLPNGMGKKHYFRCLRISFGQTGCNRKGKCGEVEFAIPLGMIKGLEQLEELTIEAGCCSQAWNNIAEQIVIELACLEKLSTLNFHFPNMSTFEKFVVESKSLKNTHTHWSTNTLRSFNISIGCCEMRLPSNSEVSRILPKRRLRFSTSEEISSVKEVLRQANSFELVGHSRVGSLSDFNLKNAGTLRVCIVKSCENMTSLVDGRKINETKMESTEETDCAILQCLEKLHLFDLQSLQSIWKGPIFSGCLANLKVLTLFDCSKLTTILNHEQARALSSLEYIKVEKCKRVVEIINEEIPGEHNISEDVDLSNVLNKVKTIDLVNLESLKSICKTTSLKWRSLVKIAILSCSTLGNIHSSLKNAENLQTLECENSWWIQLPEELKKFFDSRCNFIVMEQKSAIGGRHEGESSEHGRSADPLASNDVNVSNKHKGKQTLANGNNLVMLNTNPGHQDLPESSQGVEHVTHQPTNKNAPEICSKMDFSISSH